MNKKFVSLASNQSPSKNPYEICTFMGETQQSIQSENVPKCIVNQCKCSTLDKTPVSKVLTLQDEIRKIHQKTQANIFLQRFNKKCKYEDRFTTCVIPKRTPEQLRQHAVMCENCLQVKHKMKERTHDVNYLYADHNSFIQLKDPLIDAAEEEDGDGGGGETEEEGSITPEIASPECSREYIYIPTKNMLALKRPKSGLYINESERPEFQLDNDIPYSTYNPRELQKIFDAQGLQRIDLIPNKNAEDLWTWNVGLQKRQSELDRAFLEAVVPKFECNNLELKAYKIPKDLDKTFSAVIIFGTKAVKPQPIPRKKSYFNRPLEMACLYVAFIEGFKLNADFWKDKTMDSIIDMGEKLIEKSVKMNYKSPNNDYDIINQISERQAALNIKVHFSGPLKSEPSIYKALSVYFSKYNTCILCSNKLFLLIWKRCKNFFYIYDPNGRTETCTRDFENGKCALLSTYFVEHLVHFIVNISQTNLEDEFKLYEVILTSYGKILDPLPENPFPRTFHKQWAVVNESYAVIPGCNNGLFQPTSLAVDNPSMLISVMAILYSYIERGKCWKPDQVDELIRLGTAYYKSLRRKLKLKDNQLVTILDIPDKYVLGTFKASLKKSPFMCTGTVTDFCKKYTDSLLTSGMRELFNNDWKAALLQIDNFTLGVWRDKEFYYVYDPFRRGKIGQVLDPDDYRTQGAAILQLHANIESFLRVMYELVVEIRRGAKFFIHSINVGCIKPIMDGKKRKLRYPKLHLTPETYPNAMEQGQGDEVNVEDKKQNKKDFLSKKGKGKGGKGKGKKEQIEKVCSIESLDEKEREIVYKSCEVVEPMLDEIVCEIVQEIPENVIYRPKLYKSATRVLLRSDREYLEQLKYLVKHEEDYDNLKTLYKAESEINIPTMTLEEELQLPSNFRSLPDNSAIILGSQQIEYVDEEQSKFKGLLSAIITSALTAKYKISTWSSKLIDYSIESVEMFNEYFQTYQYTLGALLNKHIPKVMLGDRTYSLEVEKQFKSDIQKSLKQIMMETLNNSKRLLVICQRFSCLVVKRYNFLYMFSGFPVNTVGYRISGVAGPGCLMRFIELDSLIRRIEFGCNAQGCSITSFVVITLNVCDITPEPVSRYRTYPPNLEQQMYNSALEEKARFEENQKSKLRFLNEELKKENLRIENFLKKSETKTVPEKSQGKRAADIIPGEPRHQGSIETNLSAYFSFQQDFGGEELLEELEAEEEECTVDPKHDFDTEWDSTKYEVTLKPRAVLYGYRMREKDLLYKIQGSKCLVDRTSYFYNEVKPCLFASAMSILYSILKPLNQWTSHRIDQIIDSTLMLTKTIEDMSNSEERKLRNISVDDYIFDVCLRVYEPLGLIGKLEKQMQKVFSLNKYFIFQTANCSYALAKDEYYHLFDPYASMELMDADNEEEEKEYRHQRRKYAKTTKLYAERNTASWVLFADIKSLIRYLDQRACNQNWKEERIYKFMTVEIISYRKAPQSAFILQLLTGMETCNIPAEPETSTCAHNETIAWLEHCLPLWSRLNRRNAAGRYRGMAVTKLKNYDIEIDERLWSLWGNLHPQAPVFGNLTRGKQYLACCVISLCAASLYRLVDWSPQLLDSIIVNGDRYLKQSMQSIKCQDYQFSLEDLDFECQLDDMKFNVHIEIVAYGILYSRPNYNRMNLAESLMYFFNYFQFGIIQCFKKCLAIGFIPGNDGGYFMFDCQSREHPLFPKHQGASYVLRTKYLQILLYCIVLTLNVPYYNVQFTLHKVNFMPKDQEQQPPDEDE
ncbi:uncharacterized protein ACRADG_002206 isoform 1-T4 [Cochliomyia hominivorax]